MQPFLQAHIKDNIEALRHWYLWGESNGHQVINGFPSQSPMTWSSGFFVDLLLRKRLRKQSIRRRFETSSPVLWRHCDGYAYRYTPDVSWLVHVVRPSVLPSVNIWFSTGVITCRFSFNFTDIIHLVCPIHDTGNENCSSLNMRILTQLLIFAFE